MNFSINPEGNLTFFFKNEEEIKVFKQILENGVKTLDGLPFTTEYFVVDQIYQYLSGKVSDNHSYKE